MGASALHPRDPRLRGGDVFFDGRIGAFAAFAFLLTLLLPLPANAIDVQRVTSPGGIEAWLVEDHTNPIVALRFSFRGGSALDPEGREGLSKLAASTMDEGAGDLDSQAFQGRLEDLSVTLRFSAGLDTFGGRVRTLTESLDEALDLLRLALTEPRFDEEAVERIRSQLMARLRRESEDPDSLADKALFAALFPGHPYARPPGGTLETMPEVTIEDLRGFVKRRLGRNNLVVGVTGDISAADLAAKLDLVFGGLPAEAAPWDLPEVVATGGGKTLVTRKPVPQSAIQFGQPGVKRLHPDFYPLYVLNHIVGGGGFTSRLYDEIREKRGLAYSVNTGVYPLDFTGVVLGGAGTANERVGETLEQLRAIWTDVSENGVTAEELNDTKTYLTGSFPLRFSSSGRIAAILVAMQLDHLGIDFLDRRNGYVEAVTLEDVNRVARDLLDPDRLAVVVVGEPEGVD